jgi:replicative DNA helicase
MSLAPLRTPPETAIHAIDSEMALIGAAMYAPAECAEAFERLQPRHFHEPTWAAAWDILRTGAACDPTLLVQRMGDPPALKELGGAALLCELVRRADTYTIAGHADAVLDAASRRAVIDLTSHIAAQAQQPGHSEALVAALERGCADIARDAAIGPSASPVGLTALENLEAAMRGDFRGAETGLACLDRVTGGIKIDDVWFIGARTAMGKTVLGTNLARGICDQGRGVHMFSLEVSIREVQARMMADIGHDPDARDPLRYGDILKGRMDHGTAERSRHAAKRLASLPMTVTDVGGLTIDDIRMQALRQVRAWEKAKIKPGAVLIDHIGLVKPVHKTDSKAADTSDTVNELKGLAKALRCPIIALVQISRGTEGRNDKRPTLADLAWSSSIEQIGDFVCLLYRQAYYDARSADPDDQLNADMNKYDLELIVAKNRTGPICTVKAWIDVSCNATRDLPDHSTWGLR